MSGAVAATTTTTTTTTIPTAPATASSAGASTTPVTSVTSTTTVKAVAATPAGAHARSHGSTQVSSEAIAIAAIAALLLLAAAVWALARSRAYEPRWLLSLRHAMAEAGYRTSATLAELADWARLGR